MHVLNGLWAGIDELGMIMCMKHDWMVGYILHEIGMHDNSMWLVKHGYGMSWT